MIDLTHISSLRTSILHSNNNYNFENNDINKISIDDSINSVRIDDIILLDTIKNDRLLMRLFMVCGFYIIGDKDKLSTKILARTWQVILLVFGCAGLCMQVFVIGSNAIEKLVVALNDNSSDGYNTVYYAIGDIIYTILVPILQVGSQIYSIYTIRKLLRQSVNNTITYSIMSSSKKDCIIFFVIMSLLVITINPLNISREIYEYNYSYIKSYSEFAFQQSTLMIFNLATTCYLTVSMFFVSVTLKQIKVLQEEIITSADNDSLTWNMYIFAKERMNDLKKEFFSLIQLLTVIAGVSIISFLMRVATYYYELQTGDGNYNDMILSDLHMIPYELKDIIFFYYILLNVSSVNTFNDSLIEKLNLKCCQLKKQNKSTLNDYVLMLLETLSNHIVLNLGPIKVRRNRVLITLVAIVAYCLHILLYAYKL